MLELALDAGERGRDGGVAEQCPVVAEVAVERPGAVGDDAHEVGEGVADLVGTELTHSSRNHRKQARDCASFSVRLISGIRRSLSPFGAGATPGGRRARAACLLAAGVGGRAAG